MRAPHRHSGESWNPPVSKKWIPAFAGMTALLLACTAQAQTTTIAQPTPPTVAPPTLPTVTTPSTQAAPAQADVMQQLQKLMGKKSSQDAMGQVIVIGSLLGCTQKTAGKEATEAFYHEMQGVAKQTEAYCKQNQPTQARALVLSTFKARQNDPVMKAALGCYDQQKDSVNALAGKRLGADFANYANWMRNPTQAEQMVKESDVCRGTPPASTMPRVQE